MMTLEEAIKHCKDVALSCTNKECALEHSQLLKWLQEYSNMLEKQGEQKQDPCEHCKDKCLNCHNFPCIEKRAFEQGKSVFEVSDEESIIAQTTVQSIEPKFKVGNWYQCTKDFFGKGITFDKNTAYYCAKEGCLQDEYGCHIAIVKDLYDNFKLWTIQDAKDGDVLHSTGFHNDCIFIFNGLDNWRFDEPNGDRAVATGYCCLFVSADNMEFGMQGPDCIEVNTVKPATKIQHDLLFTKMKEAGYTFDFYKKELKKIEQNPAWSEEDEKMFEYALDMIEWYSGKNEDKSRLVSDWLKSLKDRINWKPSDEQMTALSDINVTGYISYAGQGQELIKLYKQLKNL